MTARIKKKSTDAVEATAPRSQVSPANVEVGRRSACAAGRLKWYGGKSDESTGEGVTSGGVGVASEPNLPCVNVETRHHVSTEQGKRCGLACI